MTKNLPLHLRRLEAESIHIMREVVAEFRAPVMLYSIGKDSSAMLHVALKAFHPAPLPFPLLHVDTTWKFKEMIEFRDKTAKRLGLDLRVHINAEGLARRINPIDSGSQLHTQVMKTEALRQALDAGKFDAAFGGARRDEEKSRAKERIFSHRSAAHAWDPRNQRPGTLAHLQHPHSRGRIGARLPALQLDRTRRLGIHPGRGHPCRAALLRQASARSSSAAARSSWSTTNGCR